MPERSSFAATLRDRIAQQVRDQILSGVLPNNSKIGIDELAAQFGSSRTPVREALIELSHQGLVEIIPRRGATVTGMSTDTIRDNFNVFGGLSGLAAEWTTMRANADLIARLRAIVDETGPDTPPEKLIEHNWRLHQEINRNCGSDRLIALIAQLSSTMPASYFTLIPEQAQISLREHDDLVNAIARGDAAGARFLAEHHVRQAGEQMVRRIENAGRDTAAS
ncbi:GntR family transcriptional regulator [Actinophytocola sediminis]